MTHKEFVEFEASAYWGQYQKKFFLMGQSQMATLQPALNPKLCVCALDSHSCKDIDRLIRNQSMCLVGSQWHSGHDFFVLDERQW